MERQDLLFVRFLAQALAPTSHELVLVGGDDAAPPAGDWSVTWSARDEPGPSPSADRDGLLALVPGVVGPDEARALRAGPADAAATLALPGGCLLVDPGARPPLEAVPGARYGRLASAAGRIPWLAAFAGCQGADDSLDPWLLVEARRRGVRRGRVRLPLVLLERALTTVRSPAGGALVELLAQAVRIANQRFDAAAAVPDPAPEVPGPLRGMLLQSKGWALTMTGRTGRRNVAWRQARALLREHAGERGVPVAAQHLRAQPPQRGRLGRRAGLRAADPVRARSGRGAAGSSAT